MKNMSTIDLSKVTPGTKFRTRDNKIATFIGMDREVWYDDYIVEYNGEQHRVYENGIFDLGMENDKDLIEVIPESITSEHDEIDTISDSNLTETQKRLEVADLAKRMFLMYAKENITTLSVSTRIDTWYSIAEKFIDMKYRYVKTGEK